jgi:Ca2+-transporting ATPase
MLVVGDICVFETGDIITADCVLKTAESFFVNQSALTGESQPVEKILDSRDNKIFSGSFVTKGRCIAEVVATGSNTELGKIANILATTQAISTPLQQKLKHLSNFHLCCCFDNRFYQGY